MVGIDIVSHSQKLAEGVVEVARMMASDVPIAAAGGLINGELGTSYEKIFTAVEDVFSPDGVVVLTDMGSAVMTAEIVLEDFGAENVRLLDCPLVEGAVVAATKSVSETPLDELIARVKFQLLTPN